MPDSPSLLLNLPAGDDLARDTRVFEKTLALLGRAAEGIVGRKNLMLFSVGFGETDLNGIWLPDLRYYPELERNLNDGNVAVYSIDLFGSRRGSPAGPGIASSLVLDRQRHRRRLLRDLHQLRHADEGGGEGHRRLLPACRTAPSIRAGPRVTAR